MSKQELNDCLKSFYTSARKQDGSYYKTSSMKSIRAAIDRFLRSPPHCKQFSIIGDPAFTEAKQVQQSSASLQPESGVLVQHNQFQHLQPSANSTAFIARGGQIFPRPQYNFSNCNVQIHNHYGQSG